MHDDLRPSAAAPGIGAEAPATAPRVSRSGSAMPLALLRDWKRVVIITLAVAAIAWMLSALQQPRYRATVLAAVAPLPGSLQPNELLRGVEVLDRPTVVSTVAALGSTPVMRARTAAPADYAIDVEVVPDTNLFRITVEGPDSAEAAAVANRIPAELGRQTQTMFKYYGVTTISPATTPEAPAPAGRGRLLAAGIAAGLFLGLLAAYVTQRRARRGTAR